VSPFHRDVGGWPPLAGVAALAGLVAVGLVASVIAAVVGAIAGAERATPAVTLLSGLLNSTALVALVAALASLTRPPSPAQFGLRAPAAPARAALLTAGAALLLAALAALLQVLGDLRGSLPVPSELDTRSVLAQRFDLPMRDPVPFGPGLVASALASCVLPVLAGELALRGFVFPALSRWRGVWPAIAIVGVLFGGLGTLAGSPALGLLSMVLGVLLCLLYLATGSLLPGLVLAAVAAAVPFAVACGLSAGGVAGLAIGCAAVVLAIAVPPSLAARGQAAPRPHTA
jgi:membrane protease YdiL (CAAX protease family)